MKIANLILLVLTLPAFAGAPDPATSIAAERLMEVASASLVADYNDWVRQHEPYRISASDGALGKRVRKDLRQMEGAMRLAGY